MFKIRTSGRHSKTLKILIKVGKLAANWEGTYQIKKVIGKRAYMLVTRNGLQIPHSWNATHLKQYQL